MNVDFFIKQIAMNKDKEKYVTSKLVKNYIPYEEKQATCESIIKTTSLVKGENGESFYRRNTPACDLLFNLTLIDKYFDIEIDFGNALKEYNALEEKDYTTLLLKAVPEREYIAWQKMFSMVASDYMENERSLVSYLDTKIEALNKTTESLASVIEDVLKENIKE